MRCTFSVMVLVLLNLSLGLPLHAESVAEKMANGAVRAASVKLEWNRDSKPGRQLLQFALAVDPENENALLLQARLERGLSFEPRMLPDEGKEYIGFLKKVVKGTRSENRQLLVYKVIELLDPRDEDALLALTKAKNKGVDTSFDILLQSVTGGGSDKVVQSPEEKKGTEKTQSILADVVFERLSIYNQNPVGVINTMNKTLAKRGVIIFIEAKDVEAQVGYFDRQTGIPHYYSNARLETNIPDGDALRLQNVSASRALGRICRVFGLGYKIDGEKVIITEKDDPEVDKSLDYVLSAQELYEQLSSYRVEFITKYRGKSLDVSGEVTGLGKNFGRDYVHLADDRVRVILSQEVAESRLAEMKAKYAELQERYKQYPAGSPFPRRMRLHFSGTATCAGMRGGRVILKECTDFSWRTSFEGQ
ncbi:MAG: OB-fold putative lipoprotein [Candidatus Pacebacteria bacterium]|nr:OB-fold putative lipoprotein [Candidatus Paceibacterota bacterium]